jgi:acetyl-CoA synthetase
VLFSSGTTGDPKAIPWTQVTPIKAAADGWAHHDIRLADVVCWPTNLGWMMGPWLIYASLLNDATMAIYQGSPLARDFGEFVSAARVTMLGVVPSLVKAWKGSGCMDDLDWSAIRCFSSTGEASTPHEMHWLMARAGYKPVIEYCGGTEIGGGYITGTVLQPQAASAFSTPALGCDFVVIDEHGTRADNGELALIAPILGSSNRLLNRDHHEVYFAGMPLGPNGEVLRRHGDQVERVGGGYYRALGRVDDTMNLGGIKTSSAEIERVCNRAPGVVETAAIAVPPSGGGPSLLILFAVPSVGATLDAATLKRELQQSIARELNPLFKIHDVVITDALPRTASNKVMRRVLRARYDDRGLR